MPASRRRTPSAVQLPQRFAPAGRLRRLKSAPTPFPWRGSAPPSAERSARLVRKVRLASSYQAYPNSISGIRSRAAMVSQKKKKEKGGTEKQKGETRERRAKNLLSFLEFLLLCSC